MDLHYKINKPANLVFDYLTDMQKFASVHPVISKIESTGTNTYMVHETLKMLGFIPYSFTYPSTVECNKETGHILIRATVKRMAHIEVIFEIKGDDNTCELAEKVIFKTRLPIKRLMGKIFKKQHTKLIRNIEALK